MTAPYARRKLRVTITLGTGTNGEGAPDTYVLPDGLQIRAHVEKVGGYQLGAAELRISGLTLDFMNKVSSLGLSPSRIRNNAVRLEAGDDQSGMATVFQGTIGEAWHDFGNAPDTALAVTAYAGLREQLLPTQPSSYRGAVDAATVMADLAGKMSLGFENGGVSNVMLSNPYFPGSAREQAIMCAKAGRFDQVIDNGVLVIVPKGGSRGGMVPIINAASGLVGYPSLGGQNNIHCRTLFNLGLAHLGQVKVESIIGPANGTWRIYTLSHDLESETSGGAWFSDFEAGPLDAVRVV